MVMKCCFIFKCHFVLLKTQSPPVKYLIKQKNKTRRELMLSSEHLHFLYSELFKIQGASFFFFQLMYSGFTMLC